MTGTRQTLGVVVERSSDFDRPAVKIASKDKTFLVEVDKLPPTANLGDWISSRTNDFEVVEQTTRVPLKSRVQNGQVQVFAYVTVPFGHCSIRDGFLLPPLANVWSPYLGYAYSEADVMFGLKEEVLYEAWFQYRNESSEGGPIWELKTVGRPLTDPAKTILLKETPWKLHSRREEVGDTSASAVLNASRHEVDGYHRGLVTAIIDYPEPGVILYCPSFRGGTISTNERTAKMWYSRLTIGQVVKFRILEDSNADTRYAEIKDTLITTRQDIIFNVKRESDYQAIELLTSIEIDDDLLTEGLGKMNLLCEYGQVTANREKFTKQMEAVCLDIDELEGAKKEGKELRVWVSFVPVTYMWSLSKIHGNWFKNVASPESST